MRCKRFIPMLLCIACLISALTANAFAAAPIDTDKQASLSFVFAPDDTPAKGTEFKIYKVASVSATVSFTLTGDFSSYPIDLSDPTSDSWSDLASTLPGYIAADGIEPTAAAAADNAGLVKFDNLSTGLYFVQGSVFNANRKNYTPQPFLICLPNRNIDDSWQYDAQVTLKYEEECDSEPVDLEVIKVWEKDTEAFRPKSVKISLYEDGKLYDTVVLDQENNWKHKWEGLYGGAVWTVNESVPAGYEVKVEKQGNRFVVTNSKLPYDPTVVPLPNTGMLLWPIPILSILGLALFTSGWLKNRRYRKENNE